MKGLFLLTILLVGCAASPVVTEVKVPVVVPCIRVELAKPDYETPKLKPDASDGLKVLALARDWLRSRIYEAQLESVINACKSL
jgi:hypothetical protein